MQKRKSTKVFENGRKGGAPLAVTCHVSARSSLASDVPLGVHCYCVHGCKRQGENPTPCYHLECTGQLFMQ